MRHVSSPLRISAIVPTHNRDELLKDTLDSISAQTRPPDELVVSDDVGNDSTRALVSDFASCVDFPVIYVDSSGSGMGTAGASRNTGAAAASCETLAFLDDDDRWGSSYLETMEAALCSDKSDFVVSWTYHEKGEFKIVGNAIKPSVEFPRALFPNPGMTGSNVLIRTTAFNRVGGFDPTLPVANDIDMFARLVRDHLTYSVVDEPLVSQVGHSGEHLTSRSERRARALTAYRAKWDHELSRAQHRNLTRFYHSALRGRDQPRHIRVKHTILQLWNTPFDGYTKAILLRLKGKRDMFNG